MNESEKEPTKEQKIWQVVAAIPKGKVASYGQVAAMAGLGRQARFVGRPWANCPPATAFPGIGLSGATARSPFLKARKPASFKQRN